jgi:hypothetical protein
MVDILKLFIVMLPSMVSRPACSIRCRTVPWVAVHLMRVPPPALAE